MKPTLHRWTPAVLLLIAGSPQSLAAGPFGAEIDLSALNGDDGFALRGIDQADSVGFAIAGAGDFNGDGIDDLIIGARYGDPNGVSNSGETYIVFGAAGIGAGGLFELSALNGANGFTCNGSAASPLSGSAVASVGDLNADGTDDFAIGVPAASPNGVAGSGQTFVVFGGPGVGAGGTLELAALNGTNGFVCNGYVFASGTGAAIAGAGDINGDGIDDLVIGNGGSYIGPGSDQSFVVFGSVGIGAGGVLELSTLNGANGFICLSGEPGDGSGIAVSAAGDINDDGAGDLLIGAHTADAGSNTIGACAVLFGGPGIGAGGTVSLGALSGADGFTCLGPDPGDRVGRAVAAAGDFNGDGIDDLCIGSKYADPNGFNSGEAYIVYGSAGIGASGEIELGSINGANGVVFEGLAANDFSGFSVSSAGDLNGDGLDDLIIGGYGVDSNGESFSGASHIVFGNQTGAETFNLTAINGLNGVVCTGADADDQSGWSVASAGDLNDDGIDDCIIGARNADSAGFNTGECYVIFGKAPLVADINGDGVVDAADLGLLISEFGSTSD